MKKLILTLCACAIALIANAQPMGRPMGGYMGGPPPGNFGQSFYELESDSIADARIVDVAGRLDMSEKTFNKMIKLYTRQYKELCRNLQMAVMEYQMRSSGGFGSRGRNNALMQEPVTVVFDTIATKSTYDKICQKYEKRYKRALGNEKFQIWQTLSATKLDNKFYNLLQHVEENTENFF